LICHFCSPLAGIAFGNPSEGRVVTTLRFKPRQNARDMDCHNKTFLERQTLNNFTKQVFLPVAQPWAQNIFAEYFYL